MPSPMIWHKASFKTIAFLADKADELNADTIFTIEGSDCNIADAVVSNTKSKSQNIASLYSMQSVSESDKSVCSYYNFMERNYDTLKEALN